NRVTPFFVFGSLLVLCFVALGLALNGAWAQSGKEQPAGAPSAPAKAAPNAQAAGSGTSSGSGSKSGVPLPYESGPEPQRATPDRAGGPDGYGYMFMDS